MSTTDLPGSSLLAGRYRLVERLGAGGMSVVWRGFDEVLGRQVAVKVLPPSTTADPSFRRRLRAEAQAAARLSHAHITNVYDYGEATTADGEPVPYVVMELVDGESLAAVLARTRRLPWPAAVRICSEVAAALAAAHSRGIVHRDVTPANVMLTTGGAKVVDFGISALIGENDIDPDGSLLGTPAYLAPERLDGGQVSPATDVYAVGLLIYRTLIGQLPWDVGTTTALLRAHQYTEPEPMPPVEGLPPAVSALIARCLEKRPDDRPSSAEVAHVLAGAAAGAPAGFVPDRAEIGEDTTILPSRHSYTDGFGRMRGGYARSAAPGAGGRGVAAVPSGPPPDPASADGRPGPNARPAAAVASASAAVSSAAPSPPVPSGSAAPSVPAGSGASPVPGGPASPVPAGFAAPPVPAGFAGPPVPAGFAAPPLPDTAVPGAGPASAPAAWASAPGGSRNSRFGALPRSGPIPAAAPARFGAAAGSAPLRPASDPAADGPGADRPARNRPGALDRARGPNTRRVLVVAGTVVLLSAATYAWSLVGGPRPDDTSAQAQPPLPSVVPVSGKCVVSYAVSEDQDGRFKANVTVANRGTQPIQDWALWFLMPGDQVISGNGKLQMIQDDKQVKVTTAETLRPQKASTFVVSGRYATSNQPPLVFELGGHTCETYVSGKPGEPSRPVEHLSDGAARLGTAPITDNPAPGITVDPDGIVRITPTATTTVKGNPTATTPTSTQTSPPFVPPSPPPVITTSPATQTSSTPAVDPTTRTPPATTQPPDDGSDTDGSDTDGSDTDGSDTSGDDPSDV